MLRTVISTKRRKKGLRKINYFATQSSKKKHEKEKKKVLACGKKFMYNIVAKQEKGIYNVSLQ